ncbi:MAG: hypothetical protein AAB583_04455 [Patescibacteria group bacterium]
MTERKLGREFVERDLSQGHKVKQRIIFAGNEAEEIDREDNRRMVVQEQNVPISNLVDIREASGERGRRTRGRRRKIRPKE